MRDLHSETYLRIQREKRINGLIFGLFAGFWFGCGVWALDALLLSRAHADLPWLKLVIGMPFMLVIGGLAGWLTARLDKPVLGASVWLAAGVAMIWIASHMPFQGVSIASALLDPNLAGKELFPFVESARMRMSLLYVISGFLLAIGGGFQMFFVEGATRSSSQLRRFIVLLMSVVIFLPVGLIVDDLINQSLRRPLLAVDELIQIRLAQLSGRELSAFERQISTRPLKPLESWIDRPYRLMLGTYDPLTFDESMVFLDFSGEWGTCSVLINTPMVCWSSVERYLSRLECLVNSGSPGNCKLKLAEAAEAPPETLFSNFRTGPVQYGILDQRGSSVILAAENQQGEQIECVFRDVGDVYLDFCRPVNGRAFEALSIPATATHPLPTPSPTLPLLQGREPEPEAALAEPETGDLAALEEAPRYTLALDISEDLEAFRGNARVDFTNNEDTPLDVLYFRLLPNGNGSYGNGSLQVESAEVDRQPATVRLSASDTVLEVALPAALAPGESIRLELEFTGRVPRDFGGSATPAGYGIYNLTDGVLALSGWYPILAVYDQSGWNLDLPSSIGDSVYSDAGYYSVEIRYPSDLILAATGLKTGQQEEDGKITAQFESGPARDFFIIASPDFQVASRKIGNTAVNSFYLPGYDRSGAAALKIAADSLEVFNTKFGPYPYRELDVVAAPMRNALGVEFPGIILIGAKLYDNPDTPDFAVTVAHEVAHQWWYSTVGNDVFEEPWLDEALTTYSSGLYYEVALGREYQAGLEGYWQNRYDQLKSEGRDEPVTSSLDFFERQAGPSSYGAVVYVKGALFFKALREEIGDQPFFQALQNYYRLHYFGIARAPDLLEEFEQAAGRDLSAFYNEWLYSP